MTATSPTIPPPPNTPSASQAEVFAALVGNMFEKLREDMRENLAETQAVRRIAAQCFEAVVRVEEQLKQQELAIKELQGTDASLQRQIDELRSLVASASSRIDELQRRLDACPRKTSDG